MPWVVWTYTSLLTSLLCFENIRHTPTLESCPDYFFCVEAPAYLSVPSLYHCPTLLPYSSYPAFLTLSVPSSRSFLAFFTMNAFPSLWMAAPFHYFAEVFLNLFCHESHSAAWLCLFTQYWDCSEPPTGCPSLRARPLLDQNSPFLAVFLTSWVPS